MAAGSDARLSEVPTFRAPFRRVKTTRMQYLQSTAFRHALFRQIHHPRDLGPVRAGTEPLGLPETNGRKEMAFFDPHLQGVCGFIRLAC